MIEIKNLTKIYNSLTAIDDLNLEIARGEVLGLLGPNGAGKTTTMKILTCFMPPTSGLAKIKGYSIYDNMMDIQKIIGYLPENNPLYTDLGVLEYLDYIASIRKIPKTQKKTKIKNVIDICKIGSVLQKDIAELSKGFRQRVGLAQALIHNPEVLILDEPTSGLDPNQIIEIRKLIKDLGKEITIILCSHILSEVEATCSRVCILNDGRIVADGTPDELTQNKNQQKDIYFEVNQPEKILKAALEKEESITEIAITSSNGYSHVSCKASADIREHIFSIAAKKKWILRELTLKEQTLEDIFIEKTKGIRL